MIMTHFIIATKKNSRLLIVEILPVDAQDDKDAISMSSRRTLLVWILGRFFMVNTPTQNYGH